MQKSHPNLDLIARVDIADLDGSADVFADDVIWHFFNPMLPDVAGDYHGVEGIQSFFATMASRTGGTFKVNVKDARAIGDELVVVQTRNELTLEGAPEEVDVVVVWRIVAGRIAEVWDIPAVYAS